MVSRLNLNGSLACAFVRPLVGGVLVCEDRFGERVYALVSVSLEYGALAWATSL